jgi:hypothetical protein
MNPLNRRYGFILSLLLAGCAAVGGMPGDLHSYSWSDNGCYHAMREDIQHLAGGPIIDCGMKGPHTSEEFDGEVRACARQAMAGTQGFAFGFVGMGDDSWFCSVAVRSADGQLLALYYDSDVTGQMGTHGNHSTVWLSHCDSVEPMPNIAQTGNFFMEVGCKEAPDALQRIISQRSRS